jgi:hypothetical protein
LVSLATGAAWSALTLIRTAQNEAIDRQASSGIMGYLNPRNIIKMLQFSKTLLRLPFLIKGGAFFDYVMLVVKEGHCDLKWI